MKYILALFCLFFTLYVMAQKRTLDFAVSATWPKLEPENISSNGRFISYLIGMGNNWGYRVVEATDRSWKLEFSNLVRDAFTPDSRFFVFKNKHDSLGILNLEKREVTYFEDIHSFDQPTLRSGHWIGYLQKGTGGKLFLFNTITEKTRYFNDVVDYVFNDDGSVLLLQVAATTDTGKRQSTMWVGLEKDTVFTIDYNLSASRFVFHEIKQQVAFISNKVINGRIEKILAYYQPGMDSALIIAGPTSRGMEEMVVSNSELSFSKGGDKIFFRILKKDSHREVGKPVEPIHVHIKQYSDDWSPSTELGVRAIIHIDRPGNVIRLEQDSDIINYKLILDEFGNGEYAVVERTPAKLNAYNANGQLRRNIYLVSTIDGTRKLIKTGLLLNTRFSLAGKYVIWYEQEQRQWYTYRMQDGKTRNITMRIPARLDADFDIPNTSVYEGIGGWLEMDKAVLIYDRYDIWKVDPDGIREPVNITAGFGRRNSIRLRVMDFSKKSHEEFDTKQATSISLSDTLLLSAFNVLTKENGFFSLVMKTKRLNKRLMMGNDIYYCPLRYLTPNIGGISTPVFPLKAKDNSVFLLKRMNTNEYPNLFLTYDFKEFKQLTDLAPQKDYIWYTTELIHFSLPNGQKSEGILYKPENFNPQKKYPIIFYYYERNADGLHLFVHPELSLGALNIPWFVSNGYLVCVVDIIFYKRGYPGESSYQAVNSAANVLSKMPWVDTHRMGLQGHSYGGWETNYIVTHTGRFVAAAPSAGVCDEISMASQLSLQRKGYYEIGQGRLGVSLWKAPQLYIENSPIFRADKVTTPLLILQNSNDSQVPMFQGTEWFNTLTRLQKKVWMLSYDNEYHLLEREPDQLDYSIRLAQFFDHYLKGLPAPEWMISSID